MDNIIKKLSFKSGSTEGFSLTVNSAGYEKCESLHSWGKGVRDHYLIHHITSSLADFNLEKLLEASVSTPCPW